MFDEIDKAIAEVQQPRSRFQLESFVLGQHATPEMRYYQTVLELQDMIYKYKLAQIAVKKSEAKIAKLRSTGNELDELKAQEKELSLVQTRFTMLGAERELAHLVDIFNGFEHKYTREEIVAMALANHVKLFGSAPAGDEWHCYDSGYGDWEIENVKIEPETKPVEAKDGE
jgi:hypothetical protein